jgi:hypothetical protein
VLEALAHAIARPPEERSLQGLFEHQFRRVLSVRTVRLREIPARYQARLVTPTRTPESLVLDVPTSEPGRQAVLEAAFEPGARMDQWNVDVLRAAAHLGAGARSGPSPPARRIVPSARRRGTAHRIGSTDLPTLGLIAVILVAVGAVASLWPAQRATRLDPNFALRHE